MFSLFGCNDSSTDSSADSNTSAVPKEWLDSDGDNYGDNDDAFQNDAQEWLDSDGDKQGNNGDAFPNDAQEWLDSDGDKHGDNSDPDLLDNMGLDRVFIKYFDIAIGATAGQPVIGSIQLSANRRATFGDSDFADKKI